MVSTEKSKNTLDSFEQLKKILLSEDQNKISEIEKELENLRDQFKDKEYFIETLQPMITTMLENKIYESKDEMAEALAPIMGKAIKKQIEDSKEDVIDALYPVIGSTIRKSIAEAMKNLIKTVNGKLDKTFSFVSLQRRIKSKVSGVSEAEIILKESIPFKIKEIFYIHKKTGLLLSHFSDPKNENHTDEDLISGMLTAIRSFAANIFGEKEEQEIHEIEYDNFQIQIEMGRYAYLALVTSGVKSNNFDEKVIQLEQKLHQMFYKTLREFEGEVEPFSRSVNVFSKFSNSIAIKSNNEEPNKEEQNARGWVYAVIIVFLFLIIYGLLFYLPQKTTENSIANGINALSSQFPELANGKVEYEVNNDKVILSGMLQSWNIKRAIEQSILINTEAEEIVNQISVNSQNQVESLIEKIKSNKLNIHDDLIKKLADLQYIFQNDKLFIEGKVDSKIEKVQVSNTIAEYSDVPFIINNCKIDEQSFSDAQFLISRIEELAIHFGAGESEALKDEQDKITKVFNWLNEIPFYSLYIYGHSDDIGTEETNMKKSLDRAVNIKSELVQRGIDEDKLIAIGLGNSKPVTTNETVEGRALNRRVTFSFYPIR